MKLHDLVKKHPVISVIVAAKALDAIILAGAYTIWPEETSRFLDHAYHIAKENLPLASLITSAYTREMMQGTRVAYLASRCFFG